MGVVEAIEADLEELEERAPGISGSALAATALALGAELDDPGNSATSKGQCAKALMEALERLEGQAPEEAERDSVDELARRRADRRGSAA